MKLSLLLLAASAAAFPHTHSRSNEPCPFKRHAESLAHSKRSREPVEVTGKHEFQAPDFDSGDQRGPCPGLNALANHGYIPRSGVVSQVFGMGTDLAMVLATLGTVWTGNPLSIDPGFSIGGRDTGVNNILNNGLGLLGTPRGLDGSHNIIEADSSNTRADLYVTGDASSLNMTIWQAWYDSFSENGTFSMDMMAERAVARLEESKATNPDFYFGPVTGMFIRNAAYIFTSRLFANYSAEAGNEGVLNQEIARNLYGVYEEDGELVYRKGWERLPGNWYRRPTDWGLLDLNVDVLDWTMKHPSLASIGGNTGTVNSFTGLDFSDLTGGVLNLTTLLEGNNLLCFVFEVLKFASPNLLSNIFETLDAPLELLTGILKSVGLDLVDLDCPAFEDLKVDGKPIWEALEDLYPGALKSSSIL
ncbi:hypothetical protein BDV18DRAFT_166679 [Aspergillus unguis]